MTAEIWGNIYKASKRIEYLQVQTASDVINQENNQKLQLITIDT